MPDDRRFALRRLRGEMSMRAFAEHLASNGLAAGRLSRHRLGDVERGEIELPTGLWDEIAEALIRGGRTPADVAGLRPSAPPIEPVPQSDPGQRLRQWIGVVRHVRKSRWWQRPILLVTRASHPARLEHYATLVQRYDADSTRYVGDVAARLDLGLATSGQFQASPDDAVVIDRVHSELATELGRVELFMLRVRLCNTGSVPWRNRLLYRLGSPVTSATPFTPGVLPVPDTRPGDSCEVLIPGRSQWLCSRAQVSYVMVFPDLTSCLPGRVCCWIDTRAAGVDHTAPLPARRRLQSPISRT
jgi:hypothetical protein